MRIEQVESVVLGDVHLVRIITEDGRVGLGQSGCWGYPDAVHAVLQTFRRPLIGRDADEIERIWHYLYRMAPFRGSILSAAVAAVDIALWDLKGQRLGVPIWQLLGGKVRDRIRLHLLLTGSDPEAILTSARAAVSDGFTAVKFDPLPATYYDMAQDRLIRETVDLTAAVRETVGPDVDLLLELHRKLTPLQAAPLIAALSPLHPLFAEDPIQIDSISSQAALARGSDVPLGEGERLHTIWEFRELLAQGGAQYVRPDVGLAGGLTHCRKIAGIAEAYHAAVVTHNCLGPILTAASVHLDATIPNFVVQEYTLLDESPELACFRTDVRRRGGYLELPETPGLGVTLADDLPDAIRVVGRDVTVIPLRSDGSVAFAV
ncbi:MAG: mandelate racemase/muconate lactonizing enzyme family protein [Chloroflexi bacterium]|nr:mandelate racemase/muconate lactonizing enzyme family protein [Chloroflexota bacterium]